MMNLPNLESINRLWLDMTDVSDKTPLHILQKPWRYTSNPIICTSRPLCTAATPCPSCTQNYTTAFPAPSTPRWWGTGPGRPGRTEPLPQGEQTYEFWKLNFPHTKCVYLLIFCNESTYLETGRSLHFLFACSLHLLDILFQEDTKYMLKKQISFLYFDYASSLYQRRLL